MFLLQEIHAAIPRGRRGDSLGERDLRMETEDLLRLSLGKGVALPEEIHSPAVDRRFDPERLESLLHHVRQDEQGGKRKANAGDFSAHLACDHRRHLVRRYRFLPRDNEYVPDRIRIFRREEKSVDQIVDVDQVVEVLPVADHDENALPDRLEQFQQPSIPRSVRFRDSDDDNGQFPLEGKHDVFSLKLRLPIDIVRLQAGMLSSMGPSIADP